MMFEPKNITTRKNGQIIEQKKLLLNESFNGHLDLLPQINSLNKLQQVFCLYVTNNNNLLSLSPLKNVKNLVIENSVVNDINSIEYIDLLILKNHNIEEITFLDLKSCLDLTINSEKNTNLGKLNIIKNIKEVGNLYIHSESISNLDNIKIIHSSLSINNCPYLRSLQNISYIGENFQLGKNSQLQDLGLLKEIKGNIFIHISFADKLQKLLKDHPLNIHGEIHISLDYDFSQHNRLILSYKEFMNANHLKWRLELFDTIGNKYYKKSF